MSKGKRYDGESKINVKKILATVVVILVIIMFVFIVKTLLQKSKEIRVSSENYFTSYANNKYGVINSDGETIIEPSYREYIVIPNQKKDIFLCTYDVNYETGEYKTKALNKKNDEIFTEYDQIEAIENYDKNNIVYYENNAIKVSKNGKYGLINVDGKEILPLEYDEIKSLQGVDNSILIYKDGQTGLVDSKGKKIIDNIYTEILSVGNDYKLGYITIDSNSKYGVLDCNNVKVLENKYDYIESVSSDGKYVVKENGVYKLIGKDGTVFIENKFDSVKEIKSDSIIAKLNNKYGVLSITGEEIIPIKYEDLKYGFKDTYIVKENGQYKLINKEGTSLVVGDFEKMNYYSGADIVEATSIDGMDSIILNDYSVKLEGIVSEINTEIGYIKIYINNEYKYYNMKLEEKKNTELFANNTLFLIKKDGKYGYTDKAGNIVIECKYDEGTEQNKFGFVAVKEGKKWGSFDKNGKQVLAPSRELENNPVKDFIGEWNLTEDINMNCYTKN